MTEQTLSEETREYLRRTGRNGGLKYAATNDVHAAMAKARAAREAAWLYGHGCSVCGERIEISTDLPYQERKRRAEALKKRHYVLMGQSSARKRGRR